MFISSDSYPAHPPYPTHPYHGKYDLVIERPIKMLAGQTYETDFSTATPWHQEYFNATKKWICLAGQPSTLSDSSPQPEPTHPYHGRSDLVKMLARLKHRKLISRPPRPDITLLSWCKEIDTGQPPIIVWYGLVSCGVVWYSMVFCGLALFGMVWHGIWVV